MTNSTYSHVNMNNKKDNSFSDFISKNEDDSNTSRGVNNITHNILSSKGSKNVFENKTNLSFHSRASSRNNFIKSDTDRENKKKAIRQSITDLINRNFNMNKNKKKESLINNINTINSFSTGLKMKSKEAQSRNKSQITFKQLNGKELSFGVVDEKSGNENNNL